MNSTKQITRNGHALSMTALSKFKGHPMPDLDDNPDELASAVREWLRFDNEVEPPGPADPYEAHLRYETAKCAITERVAALLDEPRTAAVAEHVTPEEEPKP